MEVKEQMIKEMQETREVKGLKIKETQEAKTEDHGHEHISHDGGTARVLCRGGRAHHEDEETKGCGCCWRD